MTTQTFIIVSASLFTGLISLTMMFLVFWQAPQRRTNLLLASMMAVLSGFALLNITSRFVDDLEIDPAWVFNGTTILYSWVLVLLYFFSEAFTQNRNLTMQGLSVSLFVVFLIGVPIGLFFDDPTPAESDPGGYVANYTLLGILSVVVAIAYLAVIVRRLYQNPDPRAQALWQPAAVMLGGVGLLALRPVSNSVGDPLAVLLTLPYNSLALGIAALMLGRAILQYQLFDPLKQLNEQLQATNAELERVSRAKDAFLANMSHELRTPLNSIIGYIALVKDGLYGEINEKQVERLARAERNAQHLLSLINMVLDLSKIRSGDFELFVKETEVQGLVKQVMEAVAPLGEAKKLHLTADAPLPLTLHADPERLKQVLINLLSNAIKFTESGDVSLRVAVENGQVCCFAVQDTGIGIPVEDQQKIFEEFRQVDEGATRQYQGTGLGLTISKKLVELHGGTIEVHSQMGQGSTFTVKLPLAQPHISTLN